MKSPPTLADLEARLRALGLQGLIEQLSSLYEQEWLLKLIEIEESERHRRSLARRLKAARLGSFKPMADFDWAWPKCIDAKAVREVLSLEFLSTASNVFILGPNGVGKTMILKNIAHTAVLAGHDVLTTPASNMLADLGLRESHHALQRRMRKYTQPRLLCIDEIGYLSFDHRYADLLFQVISSRYESGKSIVLTSNQPFENWPEIFPSAACVVTLIDRLVHRCEMLEIKADSYRYKEASERVQTKK
jgi:DNA replication protein DnaC